MADAVAPIDATEFFTECKRYQVPRWLEAIAKWRKAPWGSNIAPANYRRVVSGEAIELATTKWYFYAGIMPRIIGSKMKRGILHLIVMLEETSIVYTKNGEKVICCASDAALLEAKETDEALPRAAPRSPE